MAVEGSWSRNSTRSAIPSRAASAAQSRRSRIRSVPYPPRRHQTASLSGERSAPYVDCDNRGGAREAVRHLVGLGRRRIAHITGALDQTSAVDRYVVDAVRAGRVAEALAALRSAGQLTEVVNGNGGVTRYEYDANGRAVLITDPLGHVTRREFDAMNGSPMLLACNAASGLAR